MKVIEELRRFLPALIFVAKFVGLYVAGNLLYGWMVESLSPDPDPVTVFVTGQTAELLTLSGHLTEAIKNPVAPTVLLNWEGKNILSVYEGCNGVNVMIVFLAFMVGMGPYARKFFWFVPTGILVIHLMNLSRIWGLFFVAVYLPQQFYFVHKYLFTAILYVVVFLLWILWFRISGIRRA